MSEKRSVPTFRLNLNSGQKILEGPVVSPDREQAAESLSSLHAILHANSACLVYAGQWIYVPFHSIDNVQRGTERFNLPWPLNHDEPSAR